jgi:hypothetical protein
MGSRTYKKNKVAGPQFVSNLRFDDYFIAECRGQVGVSGNVSPDLPAAREEEVYDIKEGEILVCKRNGSMYTDGYAHCFSALNGYSGTGGLTGQALKDMILGDVSFIGIAETEYSHGKLGSFSEQGFVGSIAGVKTILNEGQNDVYPGMKLMLDIDLSHGRRATREKGIPRSKIRFTVKPAYDSCTMIVEALRLSGGGDGISADVLQGGADVARIEKALATERKKNKSRDESTVKKLKKELADAKAKTCNVDGVTGMKKFLQTYRMLGELVIGKSLSYARPGERFEIAVGVRNAI